MVVHAPEGGIPMSIRCPKHRQYHSALHMGCVCSGSIQERDLERPAFFQCCQGSVAETEHCLGHGAWNRGEGALHMNSNAGALASLKTGATACLVAGGIAGGWE